MVYTAVVVESLPLEAVAMVVVLRDDLRLSQSMNRTLCPEAYQMPKILCLHAPSIYKRNNIGWLVLILSSACSYILQT